MSSGEGEPGRERAAPGPESPGARLREAREGRDLSVQAAAEALGVPAYVLEALEGDDWRRFEAPVYVRGYLRKYARLLGLEENEVVTAYEASARPRDPDVRAHATTGVPRSNNTRWLAPATIGIVTIGLVLIGVWGWHRLHRPVVAAAVPAAVSAAMAVTQGAAVPASAPQASPPAATAPHQGTAPGTAALHLELKVSAPSWIEVYGPDHARLYYNLAAPGNTLTFERARGPFSVFLGNADGVEVLLNGKSVAIPPADRSGKTARLTLGSPQTPAPSSAS